MDITTVKELGWSHSANIGLDEKTLTGKTTHADKVLIDEGEAEKSYNSNISPKVGGCKQCRASVLKKRLYCE